MNKKLVISILAIVIVLAGGLYFFLKKAAPAKQEPSAKTTQSQAKKDIAQSQDADSIKIYKGENAFSFNLGTKEQKAASDDIDLSVFTTLPKESETVVNSVALISLDKKSVLVVSSELDLTKTSADGSSPIKSATEYQCNIAAKSCTASTHLDAAYKAAGKTGNWFDDGSIYWAAWDNGKNVLYGFASGEEGDMSPVYAYNMANKSVQKTGGYDTAANKDKTAMVPLGAFSPTLGKFVMIYTFSDKWDLALYDSGNLSAPVKKIDITQMMDAEDDTNVVGSVSWSKDEKTLALATDNQIYTLSLDSTQPVLVWTDASENEGDPGIDSSSVTLSGSGKYIAFIDYDNGNLPFDEEKSYTVLKAIDLKDGNKLIELLKEEDLSIGF